MSPLSRISSAALLAALTLIGAAAAPSAEAATVLEAPAIGAAAADTSAPAGRERTRAPKRPSVTGTRSLRGDRPQVGGPALDPSSGAAPAGSAGAGGQGTLSPWTTLGFRDPMCASAGRLNETQRRNCRYSETLSSRYPSANYAFDINIDSGPTNPIASVKEMLQELFNALWVFGLDALKFVLGLLQWAFGLDLFGGRAMGQVDSTLGRIFDALDRPFMHAMLGILGLWAIWTGLVQRRSGQMYAGVAVSLLMLIAAMWVIHEPRQTVGRLAGLSNDVALVLIAVPLAATAQDKGRAIERPRETFATALGGVFDRLVARPWAALNFGDVEWSRGPPEPAAVKAAAELAGADASYAYPVQRDHARELGAIRDEGDRKKRLETLIRERAGRRPPTRGDLYLRHSPNSAPRDALWKTYYGDPPDPGEVKWLARFLGTDAKVGVAPDKVAIQGEAGTFVRPALLVILLLGGLGGLLLLGWLALRLVFQAVLGFALLLCAPLALFLVVCGESGRQSFLLWAKSLLAAIISKAVYAALLAVVLLGVSVVGGLGEATGRWPMAFLLQSAFFWALFLSRENLLRFISVGSQPEGERRTSDVVRSALLAKQASRELLPGGRPPARTGAALGAVGSAEGAPPGSRAEARQLRNQESADRTLARPREALAEADHSRAQEAMAEHESVRSQLRALETTPELRELDEARQRGAAHGLPAVAASADQQRLENRRNALRAREQQLAPRAQAARSTLAEQDRSLREFGQRVAPGQEPRYHERLRRQFAEDPRSIDHRSLAHLAAHREGVGQARPMTAEQYDRMAEGARKGRPEAIEAKAKADRQIERGLRRELAEAAPPPPGATPKPVREQARDQLARAQRPVHERLARANPVGEHRRAGREAHAARERSRSRARVRTRL